MSGAAGENVDRDLYSDLVEDGETMVRTQNVALRERVKMHENEILSIRLQLQDTGEANVRLKEENLTLEKNISCLYKTAVLEIARKDSEIKRLRMQAVADRLDVAGKWVADKGVPGSGGRRSHPSEGRKY